MRGHQGAAGALHWAQVAASADSSTRSNSGKDFSAGHGAHFARRSGTPQPGADSGSHWLARSMSPEPRGSGLLVHNDSSADSVRHIEEVELELQLTVYQAMCATLHAIGKWQQGVHKWQVRHSYEPRLSARGGLELSTAHVRM